MEHFFSVAAQMHHSCWSCCKIAARSFMSLMLCDTCGCPSLDSMGGPVKMTPKDCPTLTSLVLCDTCGHLSRDSVQFIFLVIQWEIYPKQTPSVLPRPTSPVSCDQNKHSSRISIENSCSIYTYRFPSICKPDTKCSDLRVKACHGLQELMAPASRVASMHEMHSKTSWRNSH